MYGLMVSNDLLGICLMIWTPVFLFWMLRYLTNHILLLELILLIPPDLRPFFPFSPLFFSLLVSPLHWHVSPLTIIITISLIILLHGCHGNWLSHPSHGCHNDGRPSPPHLLLIAWLTRCLGLPPLDCCGDRMPYHGAVTVGMGCPP